MEKDQDDDRDESEDDDGAEDGEWKDIERQESDASEDDNVDEVDEEMASRKSLGQQENKSHPGYRHSPPKCSVRSESCTLQTMVMESYRIKASRLPLNNLRSLP
jgi:hypothetical protein